MRWGGMWVWVLEVLVVAWGMGREGLAKVSQEHDFGCTPVFCCFLWLEDR